MSCKDDIYNDMYNNVMQDTQQVLGVGVQYQKSKEFPERRVVLLLTKSENHFFGHVRLFLLS